MKTSHFKKSLIIAKILVALSLVFLLGYFFGVRLTSVQTARSVVTNFENLQKARNYDVLKLFTPATSPDDISAFSFIMALDLPGDTFPRLYTTAGFGYRVIGFQINSITPTKQGFNVSVSESREYHSNISGQWEGGAPNNYVFELINVGNELMIDKYYPSSDSNGKYTGFEY